MKTAIRVVCKPVFILSIAMGGRAFVFAQPVDPYPHKFGIKIGYELFTDTPFLGGFGGSSYAIGGFWEPWRKRVSKIPKKNQIEPEFGLFFLVRTIEGARKSFFPRDIICSKLNALRHHMSCTIYRLMLPITLKYYFGKKKRFAFAPTLLLTYACYAQKWDDMIGFFQASQGYESLKKCPHDFYTHTYLSDDPMVAKEKAKFLTQWNHKKNEKISIPPSSIAGQRLGVGFHIGFEYETLSGWILSLPCLGITSHPGLVTIGVYVGRNLAK